MSAQTLQKAFVPLAGGSSVVYNASGIQYYRHTDWLGSHRFASTTTRTMYFDGAYAPFGETYAQSGSTDLSFTGQNQDTVSNLFDFPAREYNGIHGRWPSPDPGGVGSININDPQTLNRYSYARNSPLSARDPSGMVILDDCGADDDEVACFGDGDDGFSDDMDDGDWGDEGDDDNTNNSCDADCQLQQMAYDQQMALDFLNDPTCGQAVDGGTGAAASTLQFSGTPLGGSALTLGPVVTADLGSTDGTLIDTEPNGDVGVFGPQSTMTININSTAGFFNLAIPGHSAGPESQIIALLHDLGHAANSAGLQSVVATDVNDVPMSYLNSAKIADACLPKGDDGQNSGALDTTDQPNRCR